jgi:hypothetical protein
MSNMSYCRFRNTLSDLQDCNDHLDDVNEATCDMSEEEKRARKRLIALCKLIAGDYGDEE